MNSTEGMISTKPPANCTCSGLSDRTESGGFPHPALIPVVTTHMLGEVTAIAQALPNDRIALQWDVCQEVIAWEGYYEPGPVDFRKETIAELIAIGDGVPATIELGYHLCYGSPADDHDDREAGVFYALALDTTAPPTDKTYANQKKAAEILNKVWKEQPNHPGVVHYLIHSDDSAQFAQAGLDAAICYAKIAPDVPHALHMPSHIFTRLGMWQESIDSNTAAGKAALTYIQKALGARRLRWQHRPCHGLSRIRLSADRTGRTGEGGGG